MENERFLGSEALISCPSRQPCSRQWFLWCFGAHFHPFRTFSLFFALFPPKATFAPKSGFGRKSARFCAFGPFLGSFLHPSANLALDNGFFGVLGSFFPFYPFLAPFCVFSRQNAFLGPKSVFGRKKRFLGPKAAFWASWAPSPAGWEPAREERQQRRAGGVGERRGGQGRTRGREGGSWEEQGAFSTTHPLPLHPPPPRRPPPHSYHRRWVIWYIGYIRPIGLQAYSL